MWNRTQKPSFPSASFPGAALLAVIPLFPIYYILLVLPFIPSDATNQRLENILFWPVAAGLTWILVLQNWARINPKFFYSLPIMSLIAYLLFAAASVTWAY